MKNLKIILRSNKINIILFFFIIFYCLFHIYHFSSNSHYNSSVTKVKGIITSLNQHDNKLTIKLKGEEPLLVYYNMSNNEIDKFDHLSLGDTIEINGNLTLASKNTIFNSFNYQKYLKSQNIHYVMQAQDIKIIKTSQFLYLVKNKFLRYLYTQKNKEYYLTFLMGDKSLLTHELKEGFQINGVSHLLAISGMHLNIFLVCFHYLFKNFKTNIKYIILILVLLLVLFFTNYQASISRAVIFYIFKLMNQYHLKKFSDFHLLFYTALVILFFSPLKIYDLGFIYSFVVTFGLLFYQEKLTGNFFLKMFKISWIAFLFSFPITININFEFNILSIILNILFAPLISFLVYPLCLLSTFIPLFRPIFNLSISITEFLILKLASFSWSFSVPHIPYIFLIIYYVFLLCLKEFKHHGILLIIFIIWLKIIVLFDCNTYVYYFDVGQGDSTLIITPHHKDVVLIDTGGHFDSNYSANNILKFLKSRGITRLDYLIITHGDYDHIGDALKFVDGIKIKNVIFNIGSTNDLENKLIDILNKKNISYYFGITSLKLKTFSMSFLNTKDYVNENENSSVIYFKYNEQQFLFMGDAGIKKEQDLLIKYNLKDIDFLKIGHHGSNTSSSEPFIEQLKPKYSIISVSKYNKYGHPNQNVLDRLDDSHIYRTDIDGSIEIKLNKNGYKIKTCSP